MTEYTPPLEKARSRIREKLIRQIRDLLPEESAFSHYRAILFGSMASDTWDGRSDVDLAIIFRNSEDRESYGRLFLDLTCSSPGGRSLDIFFMTEDELLSSAMRKDIESGETLSPVPPEHG